MKIRILACAEQEAAEAVDYYNEQHPPFGHAFTQELGNTLGRIEAYPNAWPPLSQRTRRCIMSRFPYSVVYQIRQDCILILAIMHMKRDPVYWQTRE